MYSPDLTVLLNTPPITPTGRETGNVLAEREYAVALAENISYEALQQVTPNAKKLMTYDTPGWMVALTDSDHGTTPSEVNVQGIGVQKYIKTWIVKYVVNTDVIFPKNTGLNFLGSKKSGLFLVGVFPSTETV